MIKAEGASEEASTKWHGDMSGILDLMQPVPASQESARPNHPEFPYPLSTAEKDVFTRVIYPPQQEKQQSTKIFDNILGWQPFPASGTIFQAPHVSQARSAWQDSMTF